MIDWIQHACMVPPDNRGHRFVNVVLNDVSEALGCSLSVPFSRNTLITYGEALVNIGQSSKSQVYETWQQKTLGNLIHHVAMQLLIDKPASQSQSRLKPKLTTLLWHWAALLPHTTSNGLLLPFTESGETVRCGPPERQTHRILEEFECIAPPLGTLC